MSCHECHENMSRKKKIEVWWFWCARNFKWRCVEIMVYSQHLCFNSDWFSFYAFIALNPRSYKISMRIQRCIKTIYIWKPVNDIMHNECVHWEKWGQRPLHHTQLSNNTRVYTLYNHREKERSGEADRMRKKRCRGGIIKEKAREAESDICMSPPVLARPNEWLL